MRARKTTMLALTAGALTAGLAAGVAAPATATTSVLVKPGKARPGQNVTLQVPECETDGFATSDAFAGSAALDGAEEVEGRAGLATIGAHTPPGTYQILAHCGDVNAVGQIVVLPDTAPSPRPTPHGAADTGFGGGAGGVNVVLLGAGGVLLAGAASAAVARSRRRDDVTA